MKKKAAALLLIVCLLFTACNAKESSIKTETPNQVYKIRFFESAEIYEDVEMTAIDETVFPTVFKYQNTFGGWYIDEACTVPFDENNISSTEFSLYAKWIPNEYTLELVDKNGNTQTKKVAYGHPIGELPQSIGGKGILYEWRIDGKVVDENTVWKYMSDKTAYMGSEYTLVDYDYTDAEIINNAAIKIYPFTIMASIHTDLQRQFLRAGYEKSADFRDGLTERSQPNPVRIPFQSALESESYVVSVSLSDDFMDTVEYQTTNDFVDVYNLEIGKTYYYKVKDSTGANESAIGRIMVESDSPRNIYCEGITNVRDVGAWSVGDKQVKQGLVFRTARGENVTANGINVLKQLGIKSEVDFRDETVDGRIRGVNQGITYYNYPMNYYMSILGDTNNVKAIKDFFVLLSKAENYPVMYHCSAGRDRGGAVSFLLGALLGVSLEDLKTDYVLSIFMRHTSSFNLQGDTLDSYVKILEAAGGETLSEQAFNFLCSIGVTEEQLNFIRTFLLENKAENSRDYCSMGNYDVVVYEKNENGEYENATQTYERYLQKGYFTNLSACNITALAEFMKKDGYIIDEENSVLSESFADREKKTLKIYYKKA